MLAIVTMWALVVGVAVGVPQSVLAPVKELARTEARQRAHLSPKLLGLDLGRRLAAGPRGEASWPPRLQPFLGFTGLFLIWR